MKYGIASKRGHTINYKRYFLASKIGSKSMLINIKGVKTMLNKIRAYIWYYSKSIYATIYNKINSMFEKIGYHYIGYKVDIEQNIFDIKSIREYKVGIYDFKAFKKVVEKDISDTREYLNNLKSSLNKRLLKLEDFELRTLKEKAERVLNLENEFDEKENAFRLANKLINSDNTNINNLVNELDNTFNYGGYTNKNDIKDVITKHINLNNERG